MNSEQCKSKPVCAVVGAGPGNGTAFARRFSKAGYQVAMLARDASALARLAAEIPCAEPVVCDVTDASSVTTAFDHISSEMGEVDVLIYNAGKGVWGDALSISLEDFETAWHVNAYGALCVSREVLPTMRRRGSGSILFVGATASVRGSAQTAAFAAAKAAQRNLAQSMARAYGPDGVHVALMVIDAVVGEPLMRAKLADRPDNFFCEPDDIADTALYLAQQSRSAWSFELDLRPFGEKW